MSMLTKTVVNQENKFGKIDESISNLEEESHKMTERIERDVVSGGLVRVELGAL